MQNERQIGAMEEDEVEGEALARWRHVIRSARNSGTTQADMHAHAGPLKIPVKVGSRFRPIWGLMGGPKLAEIGVPWVDLVPDIPKSGV